jgi:hypothetical protein
MTGKCERWPLEMKDYMWRTKAVYRVWGLSPIKRTNRRLLLLSENQVQHWRMLKYQIITKRDESICRRKWENCTYEVGAYCLSNKPCRTTKNKNRRKNGNSQMSPFINRMFINIFLATSSLLFITFYESQH